MKLLRSLLPFVIGLVMSCAALVLGVGIGIVIERRAALAAEREAALAWHGYPTATHGDGFLKEIVAPTVRVGVTLVGGLDGSPHTMMGTGVVVSADGLILTAWHISDPSQELTVQVCSYKENTVGDIRCASEGWPATVLKHDASADIALLRLKKPLTASPVAVIGNSDALVVGELLWRVGLDRVGLACGPVSRLPDGPGAFLDVLFPTSGGASGGPVYNGKKELVGIVTSSTMDGLRGYVIPVNRLRELFPELTPASPKP